MLWHWHYICVAHKHKRPGFSRSSLITLVHDHWVYDALTQTHAHTQTNHLNINQSAGDKSLQIGRRFYCNNVHVILYTNSDLTEILWLVKLPGYMTTQLLRTHQRNVSVAASDIQKYCLRFYIKNVLQKFSLSKPGQLYQTKNTQGLFCTLRPFYLATSCVGLSIT